MPWNSAAVTYRLPIRATLVSDLNLRLRRGETLVLLGRSGSGKTTTLKLINRLLEPTEGEIFIDGRAGDFLGPHPAAARDRLCDSRCRTVSALERGEECRAGAAPRALARRKDPGAGDRNAGAGWAPAWRIRRAPPVASFRAGRGSAWAWRERWPRILPILLMDEPFGALIR